MSRRRKPANESRASDAQVLGGLVESWEIADGVPPRINAATNLRHVRGWVFAAVRKIAEGCAAETLELYERPAGARRKTDWVPLSEDAPLSELLARPTPHHTPREVVEEIVCHLLLTGDAFIWISRGKLSGEAKALWPIPPQHLKAKPSKTDFLGGWYYDPDTTGNPITLPVEDVIHFRLVDGASRYYGGAPLTAVANSQNADEFVVEATDYLFRNAPHPSALLSHEGKRRLTAKERKRMELLLKRHMRSRRAGRVMFLDSTWKYTELGPKSNDMAWEKASKVLRDRILGCFGVGPGVLGLLENASRSNVESTVHAFAKFTLKPMLQLLADKLNATVVREFGKRLWAEFTDPVPRDEEATMQRWEAALRSGIVSANEARAEWLGLEKTDDGDERLVPMNYVPASQAGVLPPPAGAPRRRVLSRAALKDVDLDALATLIVDADSEGPIIETFMGPAAKKAIRGGALQEMLALGIDADDISMSAEPFKQAVAERGLTHWKAIPEGRKGYVLNVLKQGIEDGWTTKQTGKALQTVLTDRSPADAEKIARTEMLSAYNHGAHALHKTAGAERKQWLATRDGRVRPTHAALDNVVIGIDELFNVGGHEARYPLDGRLPAKEAVSCRCSSAAVMADEEKAAPVYLKRLLKAAPSWRGFREDLADDIEPELLDYMIDAADRMAARLVKALQ